MYITSVGNVNMKNTATGDDTPVVLTLQTGELDIAAADVIGQIDFQAPDEAAGTDAILVAAGIAAVSEGDFSSSNNATKLSFKTASSAAAAETMSLSSGGNLTIAGDLTVSGDDITMATNTSGAVLVADGTNFNPVVMSGDATVATDGALTIANDAVSLAKMASGTDGNIISYDASGDPVAIATGTDGQVLTSAGAGQPPAFEDAGGGNLILIGTQVASSSASLTQTGLSSTYDSYFVAFSDIKPATDSAHFRMRWGDSSGIDSGASDYSWGIVQRKTDNTTVTGLNDENDDHIELMDSSGADGTEGIGGMVTIHSPGDATTNIKATGEVAADLNDGYYGNWIVARRNTNIAIDRVQVYFDSVNIASGRLTVWGMKHT